MMLTCVSGASGYSPLLVISSRYYDYYCIIATLAKYVFPDGGPHFHGQCTQTRRSAGTSCAHHSSKASTTKWAHQLGKTCDNDDDTMQQWHRYVITLFFFLNSHYFMHRGCTSDTPPHDNNNMASTMQTTPTQ